jgi:hypothetical protein
MVRPFIVIRPRAFVLALVVAALSAQVPLTAQGLGSLARQNAARGLRWTLEALTDPCRGSQSRPQYPCTNRSNSAAH